MAMDPFSQMQRRAFLKVTGAMAAFRLTPHAFALPSRRISVIVDGTDPIASSDPVKSAAGHLTGSLEAIGSVPSTMDRDPAAGKLPGHAA